jgi:mannobiose 2-epimerase
MILLLVFSMACGPVKKNHEDRDPAAMAEILEESLFRDILDVWYPRNLDTVHGGFISGFQRDWSPTERPLPKSLVQQARHLWTTSFVYEHYPQKKEYLEYARNGFGFLREHMWDNEYGGFFTHCLADGTPAIERNDGKLVYGQSFAIYGLSQFYAVSGEEKALELAKATFLWMEVNVHDKEHGGYFEFLERDGTPLGHELDADEMGRSPGKGLKDYNSSIHILEAFTTLYKVWPDALVKKRLEEMFLLIRDTFVHPDGYLQLYFYPDWTLVPDSVMLERSGGQAYHSQHITYGHDVETAFLLLEAAHALGLEHDAGTMEIAKRMVDHSLAHGWDAETGGFFYMGKLRDGKEEIISKDKAFWVEVEGLNALLLMHTLHPDDETDYYGKFLATWDYIDNYLIDKEYGGWYSNGLDQSPDSQDQLKSHGWKTTYHNTRGMVHCIEMLRDL